MNAVSFLLKIENRIKENLNKIIALRNARTIKADLSFVTEGDILIDKLIEDVASNEREDIRLISEENENHYVNDTFGNLVVIDPIDGTENFTSGFPMWGISVSCFTNGVHVGSLLGCPEMNLWIKTGDIVPKFYSRIRGLSSSLQIEDLVKATRGHEYRILGCCVYNMINVIRGSFLSFENPKGAHSWDILAGLNIALEHKLKVFVNDKEYSGEYLQANQKYRFRIEH